ncbi:MAG: hypothetical protein EOP41_10580 [Sphingobacteriaceae bacterium]|nr:MAG: hypothetical protein EOP41_10580 [Sphingobacteriaceae bacterium]
MKHIGRRFNIGYDPIDPFCFGVEGIVTRLEVYVKIDQKTAAHANGKADNIDQRKKLLFPQVPPGDFEIVSDHGFLNITDDI